MSKYTKESPFEFEGVRMWTGMGPNGERDCLAETEAGEQTIFHTPGFAQRWHAFIEAERDEWHYTNAEKTEARKGRWLAFLAGPLWSIRHDDFESSEINEEQGRAFPFLRDADNVIRDFLAWHVAQQAPTEPEGFGYVGTLVDPGGDEWDVFRDSEGNKAWAKVCRSTGCIIGADTFAELCGTNEWEPVTR